MFVSECFNGCTLFWGDWDNLWMEQWFSNRAEFDPGDTGQFLDILEEEVKPVSSTYKLRGTAMHYEIGKTPIQIYIPGALRLRNLTGRIIWSTTLRWQWCLLGVYHESALKGKGKEEHSVHLVQFRQDLPKTFFDRSPRTQWEPDPYAEVTFWDHPGCVQMDSEGESWTRSCLSSTTIYWLQATGDGPNHQKYILGEGAEPRAPLAMQRTQPTLAHKQKVDTESQKHCPPYWTPDMIRQGANHKPVLDFLMFSQSSDRFVSCTESLKRQSNCTRKDSRT